MESHDLTVLLAQEARPLVAIASDRASVARIRASRSSRRFFSHAPTADVMTAPARITVMKLTVVFVMLMI